MHHFDRLTWKKKVSKRRERISANAYKRELLYINKLEKLIEWCSSKSIEVIFGPDQGAILETLEKRITLNFNSNVEKQVYVLLHECGHFLIGDRTPDERYGMGYTLAFDDPRASRLNINKCDLVEEEYEAWHRGWKLSQRLELELEKESFDAVKAIAILSYFKWIVAGGKI